MRKNFFSIVMLCAAVCCLAGAAGASSIYFEPSSITIASGSSAQVKIFLSDAPTGLGGYEMILTAPSSKFTTVSASFPSWAGLNNKYSTSTGYLISGIDMNRQVQSGATYIELATVTISGVSAGTGTVSLTGFRMNDDDGSLVTPALGTLQVTVEGGGSTVTTTTTTTAAPTVTSTTSAAVTTTTTAAATTTTVKPGTTTVTATSTTAPAVTTTTSAAATTTSIPTTGPATTITVPPVVFATAALSGAPDCGFTVNKVAGYAPMEVQFRDLSKGESISGWEWEFGDGGTSMRQSPAYTYRTPGTYTVSLKVTNDLGTTASTRTGLIRVLGPGEAMPTMTQAAPPMTTEAATTPAHTLPVWTSPQKTDATTPTKAAAALPPAIAVTGIAAVLVLVLRREGRV